MDLAKARAAFFKGDAPSYICQLPQEHSDKHSES
jgi:hypothetical protein